MFFSPGFTANKKFSSVESGEEFSLPTRLGQSAFLVATPQKLLLYSVHSERAQTVSLGGGVPCIAPVVSAKDHRIWLVTKDAAEKFYVQAHPYIPPECIELPAIGQAVFKTLAPPGETPLAAMCRENEFTLLSRTPAGARLRTLKKAGVWSAPQAIHLPGFDSWEQPFLRQRLLSFNEGLLLYQRTGIAKLSRHSSPVLTANAYTKTAGKRLLSLVEGLGERRF